MHCKITIPKMSNHYKLYVYSAKTADSINTIAKVKTLKPILIIDESVAETQLINDKECYIVYDTPTVSQPVGVQYLGPVQNFVPTSYYDTNICTIRVNNHTYVNTLTFNELDMNYIGTVIYYSVIGVDEETQMITHLSKVNGVLMKCEYKKGTRHIYACSEYNRTEEDVWKKIGTVSWEEVLTIGDIYDKATIARYGVPFVEKVPSLEQDKVGADIKPVAHNNFIVVEIQNPWRKNNIDFNYRKLKSYKIQNVVEEQYGEFSEPTYQSLLPLSIEKMIILRRTDTENPVPLDEQNNDDVLSFEVIRKDGIYYNAQEHKKYGMNKYNISLKEKVAVFCENSVQEKIKIQMRASVNHTYSYSVYLIDVYGNVSEPTNFIVRT